MIKFEHFCAKYEKIFPDFISYFNNNWFEYFNEGLLIYRDIKKMFRSNSYIENYNRQVKLKL